MQTEATGSGKYEKLIFILICVLLADCCLFGAGRFITFGSIGFRMALLALILAAALPLMIKNAKRMLRMPVVWMILAFAVWLIVEAVQGILRGNDRGILASDLKGFAYFAFLPAALSAVNTPKRAKILSKVVMYSAFVLSCAVIITQAAYVWNPKFFYVLLDVLGVSEGEHGIAAFTAISSKIVRIFFYSGLYLIAGCSLSIYYQVTSPDGFRWKYGVILGSCLFALLLTYTRSVYLAVFAAVIVIIPVFLFNTNKIQKVKLLKQLAAGVAVALLLLLGFSAGAKENYVRYAFTRIAVTFADPYDAELAETQFGEAVKPGSQNHGVFGNGSGEDDQDSQAEKYNISTQLSDTLRSQTVAEMMDHIKSSPVIGLGLGLAVECRSDGYSEYFYLDILSKMGIVGLVLYLSPLIYMVTQSFILPQKQKSGVLLTGSWLSPLLGMCVYSYFNPYMNAALGILCYCTAICVFQVNQTQASSDICNNRK